MAANQARAKQETLTSDQTVVYAIVLITSFVELVLTAADLGWFGSPYWRGLAYGYGAFHGQILADWQVNFAAQPITMFFTYTFLHAGWLHLLVNMLALISFGPMIARQVGAMPFLVAYMLCAVGGALLYGLVSTSSAPAVGASGALFGLLGIWICWAYLDRRHYGEGLSEIYRALTILIIYNVAFFVLLGGRLAWETHLGGFLTGWLIALFWGRQTYQRERRRRAD